MQEEMLIISCIHSVSYYPKQIVNCLHKIYKLVTDDGKIYFENSLIFKKNL